MSNYLFRPKALTSWLNEYVIGQIQAKIKLAIAIHDHYLRVEPPRARPDIEIKKANVLVLGPSGCGKTLLVELLAKKIDVPWVSADASVFTKSGYVGESADSVIYKLYEASGRDVKKTEKGIIYLDEVDKKAMRASADGGLDVSGEGVQQELLQLVGGKTVKLQLGKDERGNDIEVYVNTKNILFIFSGAFTGLEDIIAKRLNVTTRSSIGFSAQIFTEEELKEAEQQRIELLSEVADADLIEFGFIKELVGRLQIRTAVHKLSQSQLRSILTEPKDSIVRQQTELLGSNVLHLTFSYKALDKIAAEASLLATGARALTGIVEEVLAPVKYELPRQINITAEMVSYRHQAMRNLEAGEPAYTQAMLNKREKAYHLPIHTNTIAESVAAQKAENQREAAETAEVHG
ncbi:MAG: AAA family ATPase [Candidatus Obscuribacterales bacterium]|nr:AAA family ATPase [Candidatus Obscuribacterales bacterium]